MEKMTNLRARGLEFEDFLNSVLALFDLEPRFAYSLENEQIDGAFSFDTDDYILEAKWIHAPVSREQADAFRWTNFSGGRSGTRTRPASVTSGQQYVLTYRSSCGLQALDQFVGGG